MIRRLLACAVCAITAACGSSSSPAQHADAAVDAFESTCGHPGDTGNELGIGKFCASLGDCSDTPVAHLCSSIGDPTTHFCTRTCTMAGSDMATCGTNTTCTCNSSNQCGCTPNSCLM